MYGAMLWIILIFTRVISVFVSEYIMPSWHGNAFYITNPLWGESTGHQIISKIISKIEQLNLDADTRERIHPIIMQWLVYQLKQVTNWIQSQCTTNLIFIHWSQKYLCIQFRHLLQTDQYSWKISYAIRVYNTARLLLFSQPWIWYICVLVFIRGFHKACFCGLYLLNPFILLQTFQPMAAQLSEWKLCCHWLKGLHQYSIVPL